MELPLLVAVPRPPVRDLPLMELSPLVEAPKPLAGGRLLMEPKALVRGAPPSAGGLRPMGLSPLVGVARPPVAGSRLMGFLAVVGVHRAVVCLRLVEVVGVCLRLVGVAGGRALVELARPGAWDPHPARTSRRPASWPRMGCAAPGREALARVLGVRLWAAPARRG
jgi:hypothetical protein